MEAVLSLWGRQKGAAGGDAVLVLGYCPSDPTGRHILILHAGPTDALCCRICTPHARASII